MLLQQRLLPLRVLEGLDHPYSGGVSWGFLARLPHPTLVMQLSTLLVVAEVAEVSLTLMLLAAKELAAVLLRAVCKKHSV
jgi:hypothetical protein